MGHPGRPRRRRVALGPQAPDARPRFFEMRLKAGRLPDLELVPLPDEHRLVAEA